jgi:Prolyl oligopeptidase family
VHTLPGHAARAVAAANKTIRALIILAGIICGDETPLRAGPGPKIRKKYLQVAFKFAAALQAAQGAEQPILIRVDTAAGHGAGKPTAKAIAADTDVLAFLEAVSDPPDQD